MMRLFCPESAKCCVCVLCVGVCDWLWSVEEVHWQPHPPAHSIPWWQEPDRHREVRQHQRTSRLWAESPWWPRVSRIRPHVLQQGNSALARSQGQRWTDSLLVCGGVLDTGVGRYRLTLWLPLLPYGYSYKLKHPLPDWVKMSFVIFDIRALWRSGLSVRVPGCQKLQMVA